MHFKKNIHIIIKGDNPPERGCMKERRAMQNGNVKLNHPHINVLNSIVKNNHLRIGHN